MENLSGKSQSKQIVCNVNVFNKSSDVEIIQNQEVQKNLVRVKAGDVITYAQECCDNQKYELGEKALLEMEGDCANYLNDEVFKGMSDNLKKQREAILKKSKGIDCGMNIGAFSKNMCNAYVLQESAPGFTSDCMMNSRQKKMQTKLCKVKNSRVNF